MTSKDKNARAARQTESRRVATVQNEAAFAAMDERAWENFFADRGFSTETIKTLIAHNMRLPEELLLMTGDEAERIPGLGKTGLAEVQAYRKRFLPSGHNAVADARGKSNPQTKWKSRE